MNFNLIKGKQVPGILCIVIMCAAILAGCGGGQENNAAGTAADNKDNQPQKEAPLKLSMMINNVGDAPQDGNEIEKLIEDYTNTDLQIQWSADLKQKLPVMIASGDMPMTINLGDTQLRLPYVVNAMRADTFWELSPYIQDYPNLAAINPVYYENTSLDGKIYGLPIVRPLARYAVTYRKDWMDKLGLQEPKTVDELYNLLKAFATEDPDGNGKDDTYGIIDYKTLKLVEQIAVWLGGPNGWEVQNGQFVSAYFTDSYMDALKLTKRLYDEKILNPDFAVMEKAAWQSAFVSGKSATLLNVTNTPFAFSEKIKAANPDAELSAFSVFESDKGPRSVANGNDGIVVIPKSSVKTEAELKRALAFYDQLAEEKMATLLKWGIEGKHYELKDGKASFIDEDDYSVTVAPYSKITAADTVNAVEGDLSPLLMKEDELNKANDKASVYSPTEALLSQTFSDKGGELDKIAYDAKVKFVMGRINEEQWKAEMDKWRSGGGDQMAKEYAEEYAKIKK